MTTRALAWTPLLAEHNEYFYRQLLGLGEQEYNQLIEEQVNY
jgi:hypothetical protein